MRGRRLAVPATVQRFNVRGGLGASGGRGRDGQQENPADQQADAPWLGTEIEDVDTAVYGTALAARARVRRDDGARGRSEGRPHRWSEGRAGSEGGAGPRVLPGDRPQGWPARTRSHRR